MNLHSKICLYTSVCSSPFESCNAPDTPAGGRYSWRDLDWPHRSYPQIESLNKQTYANNANITAIYQNSTVCKGGKIHHTYLTPKIIIKILLCKRFIIAHYAKRFNIISLSEFSREFLQQR